jgi:hypothetical protein
MAFENLIAPEAETPKVLTGSKSDPQMYVAVWKAFRAPLAYEKQLVRNGFSRGCGTCR